MNKKISGTPFSEYREEQVRVNVFDYFVTPSFFEQFCDAKPLLIYGSRGSGKTTLFKALTLSEAQNISEYLRSNSYIGVYYRIDLNIMSSFKGSKISEENWSKLFLYYFISALNYELIRQVLKIKADLELEGENKFSRKYGKLFTGNDSVESLDELKEMIYNELYIIRDYINNHANQEYPHIGDYATIIKEMPSDLLKITNKYDFSKKIIFYLIDEFEGLEDWQQKLVLSQVKYSDDKHTFKICMRPDGLKSAETRNGEYISETDDIKSIDLNDEILKEKNGFHKYALDVCKKRFELFYKKNNIEKEEGVVFESLFEECDFEREIEELLLGKDEEVNRSISLFLDEINYKKSEVQNYFSDNYFEFVIFRLMCRKNKNRSVDDIWSDVIGKKGKYITTRENYKISLLYNLYFTFSKRKINSGFKTLVDISGGTLRYLLEICNEIFENLISDKEFSYEKLGKISYKIQSDAIYDISKKRLKQISAIPEIGINIRTFIIALGKICQLYYKEDGISKIEPNHFSIKSNEGNMDKNISTFLKECVMRGVLIKEKNNKIKKEGSIGADEYLYVLHPVYTPSFNISWRRKQKLEFEAKDIEILISSNTKEIEGIIKKYTKNIRRRSESSGNQLDISMLLVEED